MLCTVCVRSSISPSELKEREREREREREKGKGGKEGRRE
jgi:hypothetical protein